MNLSGSDVRICFNVNKPLKIENCINESERYKMAITHKAASFHRLLGLFANPTRTDVVRMKR